MENLRDGVVRILQKRDCRGCLRASKQEKVEGGTIPLGAHWTVNHYDDQDRFLGWLVVQPKEHRMKSSQMTLEETEEFGVVTSRLENALTKAYDRMCPHDKVKIVYLVRLGESTLARGPNWHLHYHMIPRTVSMKHRGWHIHNLGGCEKCQKKRIRPVPSRLKIEELMNLIRHQLAVLTNS